MFLLDRETKTNTRTSTVVLLLLMDWTMGEVKTGTLLQSMTTEVVGKFTAHAPLLTWTTELTRTVRTERGGVHPVLTMGEAPSGDDDSRLCLCNIPLFCCISSLAMTITCTAMSMGSHGPAPRPICRSESAQCTPHGASA